MGNAEANHEAENDYWLPVILTREEIATLRAVASALENDEVFDTPELLAKSLLEMAKRAEDCRNEDHTYDYG